MEDLNQNSHLRLADVLADEIAKTPGEALIGEVTEDLGDRQALAREFDTVFFGALRQSRRKRLTAAVKNAGAWLSQRLFGKPILVPIGTLAALIIAVLSYHYHDARRAVAPVVSVNRQAGSPRRPRMVSSLPAPSSEDPAGRPVSVEASVPYAPMPPVQSDLRKALAAYDTVQAYQARVRAKEASNRGDYTAAITSLSLALRSCASRCQPALRSKLDSDLARAQSALNTIAPAVAAASPPLAVNAAPVVAPAKSPPSLAWPVSGHIVVRFGERTAALGHPHVQAQTAEGITIAVPAGADIRAAADGIVSYVGADKGLGYFVLIRHDNDLTTAYGHVRKVLVKVSDRVHRGEIIAKAVASDTGAELQFYFEVRKGIITVNPMQYLPEDQ